MIPKALPALPPIAAAVAAGLARTPKSLPPTLFYDRIGSELFEQITALPEYYLTRTETAILEQSADEIAARAGELVTLIELGAGTAAKTRILIRALLRRQTALAFYPVDVSAGPLRAVAESLPQEFPSVEVRPVAADYTATLRWLADIPGRKLVLYIGSSIGNFEPLPAAALLARIRRALAPGDSLLLGFDMAKEASVLVPAYDDAQGVTAAFNKNVLARINRELGGHFDLDSFWHVAVWNPQESRMEMHLESQRPQAVEIAALQMRIPFAPCERVHTENSYKFTMPMIATMLANAGLRRETTWADARQWFTVHLARV
jgi:dimethylhistidine N-methyltransferase